MSIIYVLIPLAILLVAVAVMVFFWAVKSGQFDDLERHGSSILFDEDDTPSQSKRKPNDDGPRD
ncbi:hypothetical protein HMF8227_01481 [Saliniradius amylolyticus]|uniref:Nitrogen fixation protein FixS n=1 Tax=Saliniradius amylolyticus TaxID=2183582 RepID=A0A2S2E2R9_9ALTE|nr:cbb3-type cytochrome oxidase assembly protein CcoS [Saliniradius amylolyticus]AWL11956.1 hypothetical protein HMF8227_01481 [Saliniradius amylolyticus]